MKFLVAFILVPAVLALLLDTVEGRDTNERAQKIVQAAKGQSTHRRLLPKSKEQQQPHRRRGLMSKKKKEPCCPPEPEPIKPKPTPAPTEKKVPECFTIDLLAKVHDVVHYVQEKDHISTMWFPLFDFDLNVVGTYTDQSTKTMDEQCVTNGIFNFNYNDDSALYDSSITIQSSCSSTYGTITGGTGIYSCASGFQDFLDGPNEHFVNTVLYVCWAPCIL